MGAEWMEAVKAKELEAKKNASKLSIEKEKKFDSFGNEIEDGAGGPKIYTAKDLKEMEKKMKEMKKKNASPDEMLDLELEIDEAKKQVDKAKALEKAEKEKEKAAKKPRRRRRRRRARSREGREPPLPVFPPLLSSGRDGGARSARRAYTHGWLSLAGSLPTPGLD